MKVFQIVFERATEVSMQVLQKVAQVFRDFLQPEPIAILFAAFFGAWFAYRLQDRAKAREERASNISAANRALFRIFQQINILKVFQIDIIDPFREHPLKFIAMRPVLNEQYKDLQFDFRSLEFLLNTKHKQVLLDLFVEQQRFHGAITAINYRNELHIEVQPALERAGIQEGLDYPAEPLIKALLEALGPRLYKSLQSVTEQVVYQVDRTIGSLDDVKEKMIKALKDLYPEGVFLNFKPLDEIANKRLQGDGLQPPASGHP